MKVCDLTQFYSPRSGGVKRYVHAKISYIQRATQHEHVLVVPGEKSELIASERSRIYSIASPLVSRTSGYRALLDLRSLGEIVARERPDIIETADPYQIAWKAISLGRQLRVPVVGFYHSHFAEAYLRRGGKLVICAARKYVEKLYNRFAATLVASRGLADVLVSWGVRNTRITPLGIDASIFFPAAVDRAEIGLPLEKLLLLYVGRLAPEKNTRTLFRAFELLDRSRFHLLAIGDGPERKFLANDPAVTWMPYCADPCQLVQFYRAADLFVHPSVQETFGLAALEGQACGTPVVGIRGSKLDELILHDASDWAAVNSPQELAAAIERISRRDLRQLGIAASEKARAEYSWERAFERLFCIYAELCSS